jgi:hypothetical protein
MSRTQDFWAAWNAVQDPAQKHDTDTAQGRQFHSPPPRGVEETRAAIELASSVLCTVRVRQV